MALRRHGRHVPETQLFRFGPFSLDAEARQLWREPVEVLLPPKAFDILVYLVRNRTRVVGKQELLETVWGDVVVTENTLTQRVREIREALGDDAQVPRYVRTVTRAGYQFIGVVEEARSESRSSSRSDAVAALSSPVPDGQTAFTGAAAPVSSLTATTFLVTMAIATAVILAGWLVIRQPAGASEATRITSIAVLPLANLSEDRAQDYFAEGMTDELTTKLAGIPTLRVISRTSALRYRGSVKSIREIGRELDVDAIVEGSVLRSGEQARITLKLIEVATDRTVLAESFARQLQDILTLQSEIARVVAERIHATVSQEPARVASRVVPEAFEDYLKGRSNWNTRTSDGVKQALAAFQRATARDPTYAAAWAGIADCYIVFSGALLGVPEHDAYAKAREAALRALALDETLAEAHTSLGSVKNEHDWDWAGAEAEYTRAIAINSNYVTARQWYGEFLYFRGRYKEAIAQLELASRLDPLSPVASNSLAIAYLLAGQHDEALARSRRTLEIDAGFSGGHLTLGQVHLSKGQHAEAIAAFRRAVSLSTGLSRPVAWLGHAYAVAGEEVEARRALRDLEALAERAQVSPYDVALVHTGLGEIDQAFSWLERAYLSRGADLLQLGVDKRLDRLRHDPRFAVMLRRIGMDLKP
jgi:TolB-like protein/DNA-binding winged helix-turn-helix (wHTH) protein/tetratricopeptide (TPR) repeat protein